MLGSSFTDIAQTIQIYLDGLYDSDTDKLRTIFVPGSRLIRTDDGLNEMPFEAWCEVVDARPAPRGLGGSRDLEKIVRIELLDDGFAVAHVQCAIAPNLFNDTLDLVKTGGQWKISLKKYRVETLNV